MIFRWIFAPGFGIHLFMEECDSYQTVRNVNPDYFDNLSQTWHSDQINSLSVKILYYIDYNSAEEEEVI